MKKLSTIIGIAGVLFATNLYASYDGTVTLSQGQYSYGNGGEFTAVTTGSGLGTFQTFCIEYNEEFGPGNTYQYKMNTGAVAGGPGAVVTDPNTGLPMDNISIGTAWLYSQFRAGTLANYFTVNQQQNAGALQQAIWWLEDETGGVKNGFVTAAEGALGNLTDAQVKADSLGAYGVIALNLFNGPYATTVQNYNLNQDQLAINPDFTPTPIPEPTTMIAGALLLLPFGASTLRILRKNRAA